MGFFCCSLLHRPYRYEDESDVEDDDESTDETIHRELEQGCKQKYVTAIDL